MKIRKAIASDAPGISQVRVSSWQTSYAGILPAKYLSSLDSTGQLGEWQAELAHPDPTRPVYVAENGNQTLIGYAAGGPERNGDAVFRSELYAVYLLENKQHQGIGRQLVHAVAVELAQAGFSSMLLWTLAANPARSFYEKLGGELVDQKEVEIGGSIYTEVSYGWRDIHQLIEVVAAPAVGD